MFKDNLAALRRLRQMTQEDIAEKLGVSRQSVAKWEAGETVPDLDKCRMIADIFDVSLDDLANYESEENHGLGLPPKGKHLFGMVTVGDKGQIVIPADARKLFNISAGDKLVVLGDENQGIAVLKSDMFLALADAVRGIEP
ncbi:MAG: helix-turn-helix domain-containing protein [Clostridiales bacterium]|jgi:AbrB family looped-hinge helix DNA binding protein|nr:helix-turn-helix domain-containing protein [Clostridiales bacterium]MBE6042380.1 helix-turn-helix domain-containing protein [Clostridiales bacterium]